MHTPLYQLFTKYISGYLASDHLVLSPVDEIGISGWTPTQLFDMYMERISWDRRPNYQFAPRAYDTMWTAALALNNTIKNLKALGTSFISYCI